MNQLLLMKYLIKFKKKNQVEVILIKRIIERVENIVQKIQLRIINNRECKIAEINEVKW